MNPVQPRPSKRLMEGLGRLRHNMDFGFLRQHLEAEQAHYAALLVELPDDAAFRQIQGRAQEVRDLLKLINTQE